MIFQQISGAKRSHHMLNSAEDGSQSTGLTQEIDIMDIGSSTPKRKKSKSPLKGVLKIRYLNMNDIGIEFWIKHLIFICRSLSDDEAPANELANGAHVMFSTPVSSLKTPRNSVLKLKTTRFELPPSEEKMRNKNNSSIICATRYMNVRFVCGMILNETTTDDFKNK